MFSTYKVLLALTGWSLAFVIIGAVVIFLGVTVRVLMLRFRQSTIGTLLSALKQAMNSGELDRWIDEPRSVSGLDSILAPRIARDFPTLNIDEMKNIAKRLLRATVKSLENGKIEELENASETYKAKLQQILDDKEANGVEVKYGNIVIHRVVISDYQKRAGHCRISFQVPFRASYKEVDEKGRIIAGTDEHDSQLRFTMIMVYVQDVHQLPSVEQTALTTNCPNCGAPLTELGSTSCQYCGSPTEPINIRVWQFDDFIQD